MRLGRWREKKGAEMGWEERSHAWGIITIVGRSREGTCTLRRKDVPGHGARMEEDAWHGIDRAINMASSALESGRGSKCRITRVHAECIVNKPDIRARTHLGPIGRIMSEAERPSCKLYSYFRSSCSWRVRIAMHIKGLAFETMAMPLLENKQSSPAYTAMNPNQLVPTLVLKMPDEEEPFVLHESCAIMEFLEEQFPRGKGFTPLLPSDIRMRAKVRHTQMLKD